MIIRAAVCITASLAILACSDATEAIFASKYIVTTSKSTVPAGDTVYIQAQLADAGGRSVRQGGVLVSWYTLDLTAKFNYSQSVTDGAGVATTAFIAGTKAGVADFVSVIDARQLRGESPAMNIVPGVPSLYLVTASGASPVVGSTISLSAQLVDKYQNQTKIGGRVVTWSLDTANNYYYDVGVRGNRLSPSGLRTTRVSSTGRRAQLDGTPGSFSSPTSTTDAQGLATINFTVGTAANESYVVKARDDQSVTGSSSPINTQPGAIAKFSITVSVADPPAGAAVVLTATAADSYGNRVLRPGSAVQWSVTGTGGSLSAQTTTTDQNGVTTNLLTTATAPGAVYTVSVGDATGLQGTSPTITTLEQLSLASLAAGIGSASTCGLATDAKVWCWGAQNIGTLSPRPLPGKPIGDMVMSSLSTSVGHTCGISGGTVLCWGQNAVNQLGDNSRTFHGTPTPINSSLSFTSVSTGTSHSCALTTAGDIYCWGLTADGRLGDGGTFTGLGPVKIASNLSFIAVAAGGAHTCAIATSGDAYCWGANEQGQLGNSSRASSPAPVLVSGGLKFTAISAGNLHTCGISSGSVYCWGDDTFGEMGDDAALASKSAPTPINSTATFVSVAAGGFHSCAIGSDARASCWGDNTSGELGNPTLVTTISPVPTAVTGGLLFKSIAVGGGGDLGSTDYYYSYTASAFGHSCGVTTAGVTYCWGSNSQGELGISPDSNSSAVPKKVSGQQ